MDLARHQRILLGLIRSTYQVRADDDDYFHCVAASRDLAEARGNVLLWRVYVLERTCVLTVALLRQRQRLTSVLQEFIRQRNISPFREFQPRAFLAFVAADEDSLTASVAQFELALSKVREGESGRFAVRWSVEPGSVLKALAEGESVSASLASDPHVAIVDRDLPGLFTIERVAACAGTRSAHRRSADRVRLRSARDQEPKGSVGEAAGVTTALCES